MVGGWADETLSARAWRLKDRGKGWSITRKVIDFIFFFEKNHCAESYVYEKLGKHSPPELRPE
jgi:hypothetical protein